MTLSDIITRVRRDSRQTVDPSVLIDFANDIQQDIFNTDSELFSKEVAYTTTDDTYLYTLSNIASDIRKIKLIYVDLSETENDYMASATYNKKYFRYKHNDINLWLEDDPDGEVINVRYYRTPTTINDINDTPDLPERWRRLLYYGIMSLVMEGKDEQVSPNWFNIFEREKKVLRDSENMKSEGAFVSNYYSLM